MVVVTCALSCTIRRCVHTENSHTYLDAMLIFMKAVCQKINANIASYNESTPQLITRVYEDKLVAWKFDISVPFASYTAGQEHILEAYRAKLTTTHAQLSIAGLCYWLEFEPEPSMKESDLSIYYYNIPLATYTVGFMTSANEFQSQFNYEMELTLLTDEEPRATIELDKEKIKLDFVVSKDMEQYRVDQGVIAETTEVYRLEIDFKHLSPWVVVHSSNDFIDIIFLANVPLQLWRTQYNLVEINQITNKTYWIRTCSVKSVEDVSNQRAINKNTLGGSNCFMLRMSRNNDSYAVLESLRYFGGFTLYHTVMNYRPRREHDLFPQCLIVSYPGKNLDLVNWLLASFHSIGYRVKQQFAEPPGEKFMEIVHKLASGSDEERNHLEHAMNRTYDIVSVDSDKFLHIDLVLQYCLDLPPELEEMITNNGRFIKRLIITPSRLMYLAPSLIHDNRILREFDPDSAVSCSFQNDDLSKLNSMACTYEFINEAVGDVLREGVTVSDRHYEFLACSGSQLSDHGCWFYAKDARGNSAADIRHWMGDLEHIRNPGTYLSRMGQCFSDTTAVELGDDVEIQWTADDVEGGADTKGDPYCFSDGVGRISKQCMDEVFLGIKDTVSISAFQVRLGGTKGMLALDHTLQGKQIILRKSMFKFESQHRKVEVMRRTQPSSLYLNRQIITLLTQLHGGIPDKVFIKMQNNMLHRLADILLEEDKAVLSLSQSGFSCCYAKLHRHGFNFTLDPFFKGVLKAITCARISYLTTKARIEISADYARDMLGVMDEYGVLKYGEVFFQYSADIQNPGDNLIVHQGEVVVSKMPALHPGDVRKFMGVDRPELRHLVDCIVFPQLGDRPHPNEMAGSDLDGDEYFVCWLPDLIFHGRNEIPMDFISIKNPPLEHAINLQDMVEFIVNYIVSDKKGVISNAHLEFADQLQDGIHSSKCKELAELFCHVIDFGKTGFLPALVKSKNFRSLLPKIHPDFMEKFHQGTYQSKNVLGKLYRITKRVTSAVKIIDKEDDTKINDGSNWSMDERLAVRGHEAYLEAAENLYGIYSESLDALQQRYGIESEEQLVSGLVIKIKGNFSRSDDLFEIERRLRLRLRDITALMLKKFNECAADLTPEDESKSKTRQMIASACYVSTYREKKKHRSFPWLFADDLLKILQQSHLPPPSVPLVLLSRTINDLDLTVVNREFILYKISRPNRDVIAKVYFIMISWGKKSRFIPTEGGELKNNELTVRQFVKVLDIVCTKDEEVKACMDNKDTGPILLAIFRAVTNMDEHVMVDGRELERMAVVNMKQQMLLGHHQLARNPTAACLQIRLEGRLKRTINIPREKWVHIRKRFAPLGKEFKEKYNVSVWFSHARRGQGSMIITGDSQFVDDFTDLWFDDKIPIKDVSDMEIFLQLIQNM